MAEETGDNIHCNVFEGFNDFNYEECGEIIDEIIKNGDGDDGDDGDGDDDDDEIIYADVQMNETNFDNSGFCRNCGSIEDGRCDCRLRICFDCGFSLKDCVCQVCVICSKSELMCDCGNASTHVRIIDLYRAVPITPFTGGTCTCSSQTRNHPQSLFFYRLAAYINKSPIIEFCESCELNITWFSNEAGMYTRDAESDSSWADSDGE